METPTTTPTQALTWKDAEKRRQYQREYWRAKKAKLPPPEKKVTLCDWSDPVAVKRYKKEYGRIVKECTVCGKCIKPFSGTHHRRSSYHLLAVRLRGGVDA